VVASFITSSLGGALGFVVMKISDLVVADELMSFFASDYLARPLVSTILGFVVSTILGFHHSTKPQTLTFRNVKV